jgi:HlyD family secretion protein
MSPEIQQVKLMKTRYVILIILALLGVVGVLGRKPLQEMQEKRAKPNWRTADVKQGRIVSVVNSTGTVKPVMSIQVGSFVSGPLVSVPGEFNAVVKDNAVLAEIDPRLPEAEKKRAQALRDSAEGDVDRVEALLEQARRNEARAKALSEENEDYISQTELDQFKFGTKSLEAQLTISQATVKQAQAALDNATTNLNYATIRYKAPVDEDGNKVDGIIIDRKIEMGQTLQSGFQTPELFVIALHMREKMHVHASVDEADIGLIKIAKENKRPVHFTVDAYPDDLFEGVIFEVRPSSTELQNVVTYPVIVETTQSNEKLKLMPGMTASISFRVEERLDVVKIPNSALRFYPQKKHVRKEDHELLEGTDWMIKDDDDEPDVMLSAKEKAAARKARNMRHVWVAEGNKLKAVVVITGLSDSKYTELISGDITIDTELVTGIKPKKGWGS